MRDMAHAQVSTDAQENDLGFEVTPFERTRVLHEGNSFYSSRIEAEFTSLSTFLCNSLSP